MTLVSPPADGSTVVMLFPDTLPCLRCAHPSHWFSLGVEGCPNRCGARDDAHQRLAESILLAYRADLPRLSKIRKHIAATTPARPVWGPRGFVRPSTRHLQAVA